MTLKQLVEDTNTRAGRWFDLFIQSLIILSLASFTVDTLPGLSPAFRSALRIGEIVLVLIFTLEYVARVIVADSWLRFVFSIYGLIDLVAILPFYLATGLDLRSVRSVRLLRLFRLFKLLRYSGAMNRVGRAFATAKEEIILFFVAAMILIYLSAVGIWYFERAAQPEAFASIFDGLWWAVATLTTVGYGDVTPITVGGKVFTFVILMLGLGIVAVPTGMFATALAQTRRDEAIGHSAGDASKATGTD